MLGVYVSRFDCARATIFECSARLSETDTLVIAGAEMTCIRARASVMHGLCEHVSERGSEGYPAGGFACGDAATDTAVGTPPVRLDSGAYDRSNGRTRQGCDRGFQRHINSADRQSRNIERAPSGLAGFDNLASSRV